MRPPLTVVPYLPMLPQRGVNAPARPLLFPQGPRGFGGFAGTTGTAASGAASGAAAGASIGSVVPGVGTAIGAAAGAIVGAISGLLGGKSNPQIQIDKTNAINLFSQYQAIAGTVSGRSIGYENMDMIFRGACFMGHFPDWNNETELPDSLMSMPGSPYGQNDNCFAVLWASAARGIPAPGSSGVNTGNGNAPVTSAKVFVDNYVWPANSPDVDTDPWATNTDSIGKQVIYDAADAYIATQSSNTTPYIATAPAPASAPVTQTVSTTIATPSQAPSASGSYLVMGQGGSLVTPPWGTWTINSAGVYQLNGSGNWATIPTATTVGAVGLVYSNGQVYAYDNNGLAYLWGGGGWTQTNSAPAAPVAIAQLVQSHLSVPSPPGIPTTLETADGSEVAAPGTALETASGAILYFGPQAPDDPNNAAGYPVWASTAGSAPVQKGYVAGMILGNGGTLYGVQPNGAWYQWVGNTNNWEPLAAAPNLNGPTTTASTTQASPQSGVACTVGNTPVTSGAVVTTTATGDAVTDDDIQDLIAQVNTGNATAQQVYTAVLQALQDQGSTVSAGVQSQVASQVAASVPTTAGTSNGSSTGLYIVGGGLALLGLIYFLGHRKSA
jgi:hypothetical protein